MAERLLQQVKAVDGLLPLSVVKDLREQVKRIGESQTWWYDFNAPPRTLFEQVIEALRARVAESARCVGAEWWMRAQTAHSGFKFHFDRDEAVRERVVSPLISSILYLSDVGGPTLILDRPPGDAPAPKKGVAVHPCPGRFATFPGTLLHGVLPGDRSRWPRVAMFINWWDHKPIATQPELTPELLALSPIHARAVTCRKAMPPREGPELFAPADMMPEDKWQHIAASQIAQPYRGMVKPS